MAEIKFNERAMKETVAPRNILTESFLPVHKEAAQCTGAERKTVMRQVKITLELSLNERQPVV